MAEDLTADSQQTRRATANASDKAAAFRCPQFLLLFLMRSKVIQIGSDHPTYTLLIRSTTEIPAKRLELTLGIYGQDYGAQIATMGSNSLEQHEGRRGLALHAQWHERQFRRDCYSMDAVAE